MRFTMTQSACSVVSRLMGSRTTLAVLLIFLVILSISMLRPTVGVPQLSQVQPTAKVKPKPDYPAGIPLKFDIDGNVQPLAGNTIISHVTNASEIHSSLLVLYDRLKNHPLSHLYTLLPPTSWHMTVFEGVVDKVRKPGLWPSNLAMDASLEECTTLFERQLSTFDLQTPLPYHLTLKDLKPLVNSISLWIVPHTADDMALRGLRDRLSDLLHIRAKSHDKYRFHIGIGYILRWLTDEQDQELRAFILDWLKDAPKDFELGAPEFCLFDDMFGFEHQMYLKDQVN